jgi:hypothetical protein
VAVGSSRPRCAPISNFEISMAFGEQQQRVYDAGYRDLNRFSRKLSA